MAPAHIPDDWFPLRGPLAGSTSRNFGGARGAIECQGVESFNTAIDEAIVMTDGSHDQTLARDMIEVHGTKAATVARGNARAAALAGQAAHAKSWIRVLGIIQRQQAAIASPIRVTGDPPVNSPDDRLGGG